MQQPITRRTLTHGAAWSVPAIAVAAAAPAMAASSCVNPTPEPDKKVTVTTTSTGIYGQFTLEVSGDGPVPAGTVLTYSAEFVELQRNPRSFAISSDPVRFSSAVTVIDASRGLYTATLTITEDISPGETVTGQFTDDGFDLMSTLDTTELRETRTDEATCITTTTVITSVMPGGGS